MLGAGLAFVLAPACTFTTSLDGLTTPRADGGISPEAGSDVEAGPAEEAGSDAFDGSEAGSAYASAVLADAPIAWYRLDEAAPTAARDERGRFAGNYTTYSAPDFQLGQAGAIKDDPSKSVRFLGGSIEVRDAFAFPNGEPFTLELWIDLERSPASEFARVLSMENTPNGYNLSVNDDKLFFEMRGGGQPNIARFTALPVGWAHCVVTYDGQVVTLYLDAVKKVEFGSTARFPARSGPFAIGGASYGGVDDHAKGRIDEVAIYDKVLSVERIGAHYAAAK